MHASRLEKKVGDVNKLQVYFPGLINAGRKIKLYFVIAKVVSFTVSSPVLGWTEAPMCKFPHTYLLHVVPWEKERWPQRLPICKSILWNSIYSCWYIFIITIHFICLHLICHVSIKNICPRHHDTSRLIYFPVNYVSHCFLFVNSAQFLNDVSLTPVMAHMLLLMNEPNTLGLSKLYTGQLHHNTKSLGIRRNRETFERSNPKHSMDKIDYEVVIGILDIEKSWSIKNCICLQCKHCAIGHEISIIWQCFSIAKTLVNLVAHHLRDHDGIEKV